MEGGVGIIAMLNSDDRPSEELVKDHRRWLIKMGWMQLEDDNDEGQNSRIF